MVQKNKLRIGFVPEHFSTPLHFAQKHFDLNAETTPFPTGTGAMAAALKDNSIDVAIGLTEGFVADLGRTAAAKQTPRYGLVGTYVESPLCWAISVGGKSRLADARDLKGKRVGVSRIGSGSYVMSYVLADRHSWLTPGRPPFEPIVLGDFAALRAGVNANNDADFFMWEHFTTKKYYDNGELKRIGEIYTPWPSWMIAARDAKDERLEILAEKLNKGVAYFLEHRKESIDHITSTMEYSPADAEAWLKTVEFAKNVRGVDLKVVESTVSILQKAGVLPEETKADGMVAIKRSARATTDL
ncbi:periplasmic binding protein-like II [Myriangium duriaei CBS 260.36]|uniref:Periplasmic binding protein-like II n=1 Tax=Myriangium duriaei CBS 260.36 TaxID=1168546 RepID=A0A9P4J1M3_9PEZI|nr:periplasmic binding protein-like II [Myriangium duriaei CBS 260.36]